MNDKMDDVRAKAQAAKAETRVGVEAGLSDVEVKRDAIVGEFATVDTKTEKAVDNFKDKVDKRIDQLEDRVDTLGKKLEAK